MLTRGLFFFVTMAAALPAVAGDRPLKASAGSARALLSSDKVVTAPSARSAMRPVRADLAKLEPVRSSLDLVGGDAKRQNFALLRLETEPAWKLDSRIPEVTADAAARYAVRDTLGNYRKPRFRKSALGALLTLRMDGNADTPSFDVGGGGVASALWGMVPKN